MPNRAESGYFKDILYLTGGAILLSAVSVLDVARLNLRFLVWSDFWETLLIVAGVPGLVVALVAIVLRRRLYFAASVVLVNWMFFNFIGISSGLETLGVEHAVSAAYFGILLLFPILFVTLSFLPQRLVSSVVGMAGCAVFAVAATQLALSTTYHDIVSPAGKTASVLDPAPLPAPGKITRKLPDIIYIVPDRYGNAGVLSEAFGRDNSAFLEALHRRGFAVAEHARANYLKTHYSLASSMNMQYIEAFLHDFNGKTRSAAPLYALMENNLVTERLKKLGYRYVHVGSWWDPTSYSKQADLSVSFTLPYFGGEFGNAVIWSLPILRWVLHAIRPPEECAGLKRQLSYLENAGGGERPTFVFAHVLAPHSPILTDAAGNCISPMDYPHDFPDVTWDDFRSAYADYVAYLNRRFLEIFDRQRATNPNLLIFVLQGDEGPFPKAYRESELSFDWREASDAELAMKFGILNALYLGEPDGTAGLPEVPDTLSPVNNWRIIFSHLEGVAHPLLPDRQFIFPTNSQPYRSIEITEHLNAIP